MNRNEDYKADLLEDLRNDPEYAAEYLSAAKADSNEAFLVALRDVAEAQMGMKRVAKAARVNRENLYRALSRKGNPSISTLDAVLEALSIEVKFVPKEAHARVGRIVAINTSDTCAEAVALCRINTTTGFIGSENPHAGSSIDVATLPSPRYLGGVLPGFFWAQDIESQSSYKTGDEQ